MRRDPRVVVLGEDVGRFGGVFRATSGLQDEFGADRCIDTPLAEAGIIGTAIGMALYGMRPVPEIQFGDFIYPGVRSDRERAGQVPLPLGRRVPGAGRDPHAGRRRHQGRPLPLAVARGAVHPHAGAEGGLPVEPVDAKGLLASAIRGEDPVHLHGAEARLPRSRRARSPRASTRSRSARRRWCAKGTAGDGHRLERDGAHRARGGARRAPARGFDLEVIDLRTLMPFDIETHPRRR